MFPLASHPLLFDSRLPPIPLHDIATKCTPRAELVMPAWGRIFCSIVISDGLVSLCRTEEGSRRGTISQRADAFKHYLSFFSNITINENTLDR